MPQAGRISVSHTLISGRWRQSPIREAAQTQYSKIKLHIFARNVIAPTIPDILGQKVKRVHLSFVRLYCVVSDGELSAGEPMEGD